MIRMGLKDAKHIKAEDHARLLEKYPDHEREARTEGIPILGSGLVYTAPESIIRIPAFQIPQHWAKLIAVDLGGGQHPFAAVLLAWDRDVDQIFVVDTYKRLVPQLAIHCSALRKWGRIPVCWPHDAGAQSRGAEGRTYAQMMQAEGLDMLPSHATHTDGSFFVEPGIQMIQDRLSQGKLRVFEHLLDWFDEYRLYHRKEGKIVKADDDLMDAMRYGVMMIRAARTTKVTMRVPEAACMDYDPFKPRQQSLEIER